ncbi:hypothetical protein MBM09_08400 [Flaviramulus sp. BrNp1-15]|nr:hypothetical protein [Flaviramulus sp. BrNp1-15]ULC57939.1 hypothetical protein MBM09_08400 [Flaviramulus sp. BrNp1-15]
MTIEQVEPMESNHNPSKIFMSIDHLKEGTYQLNIMCDNKIVKTLKFKKY